MNSCDVIRFSFLQLSTKEQWFIKSLLTIYKQRAQKIWEYEKDISLCQVVFLGEEHKSEDKKIKGIQPYQYVILLSEEIDILHTRLFKVNPRELSCKILAAIEKCEAALVGQIALNPKNSDNALSLANFPHGQNKHPLVLLKLLRWPSVAFIRTDPNYAVLATLIMNKQLSFNELVQKSGFDHTYCTRFMHEAKNLGYIEVTIREIKQPACAQSQKSTPEKLGMFARIRSRLGLRRAR